ncbi:antirestriction protein ArdA [Chryseobacterium sp. SIMBA_028]|uniref:antirestriction protein ArdA n=1 Tax=Chryseobacterium sp. SIMBA_028 TaxID=3085771 RepID=UPI00397D7F4C
MTNLQNCLDTARIYIGTYKKYNESSLFEKWPNLSDYSDYDELLEAMKELHQDEHDPEFMLQDYENCSLFEKLGLIEESYLSNEIFEIAEQINDSGYDLEIFEAYLDCIGKMDFQSIYKGVVDYYMGEYSSDEDFVQYLYEDDTFNIPNWVVIDWEATARSIMFDYFESGGHYFRA